MTSPQLASNALPGEVTYADVLRNRNFRRLWGATITANLGESIAQIALPLLVFAVTESLTMLGVVYALSTLPKVVLAPFAGVLADRVNRRSIMLGADVGRMIAVLFLPFADSTWQITTIALIVATFSALAHPAEMAAVPMVIDRSLLVRALSLIQVTAAGIRVIGPVIGAALVTVLGAGPTFFAQSLCFVLSVILVLGLRLPDVVVEPDLVVARPEMRRELTTGFRVMWRQRVIRAIVGAEMVWGGAGTLMQIGLLAYTSVTLDLGDDAQTTFALLVASFSAGTVAGGLLASRVQRRLGRSFMLGFGYFAPLLLIAVVFVPPLPVVAAALFLFGLSDSLLVIASQQLIVERIPDTERGRFYAVWTALITLAWAGWNGLLGQLTDRLGAPTVFLIVGLAVGLGCPLVLLLTGTIRELLTSEQRQNDADVVSAESSVRAG